MTELFPILNRDIPAYILAGGKSSRFGSDKARVPIRGVPNLLRLVQSLERNGHRVLVVADREDRYHDLKIQAIADTVSDSGPLAGLATALKHYRGNFGDGWILLISCDQLVWKASWFQQLVQRVSLSAEAVVFGSDVLQPIPGLYHTNLLPLIEKAFYERELSVRQMLLKNPEKTRMIVSDDNPRHASFNDPEEFKRLLGEFRLD